MYARLALLLLATASAAQTVSPAACGPSPNILHAIQKAEMVAVTNPMDFDRNVAPFRALRDRYPADLFVNERYQDAVQQFGIEGHLRALTQEYGDLLLQHPDEVKYKYLAARAMIGRSTASATANLVSIISENPKFAPAYASLAEIYASDAFHNVQKENTARAELSALCPATQLVPHPPALPAHSRLIDQAEQLIDSGGAPDRVAQMAGQGIREDEWRLQRVRAFDWYSVDLKRQMFQEVRAEYWKLWSIQVRCYRRSGQPAKAAQLLATMEQRAGSLQSSDGPSYWESMAALARLYIEGDEKPQAAEKLNAMSQFLSEHPDPSRETRLEDLRTLLTVRSK